MPGLLGRMRDATNLTRAGRLTEATSLIQKLLGGSSGERAEPRDGPVLDHAPAAGAGFAPGMFANEAGGRPYKLFIPGGHDGRAARPLLVMLHGCTQSPDDFAAGTRMNALAGRAGALVLYPAQTSAANAQRCWNWFNEADQHRDAGEPAIIAGMTRSVMTAHGCDPARVFVAGLSAGGAAAAVLGQAYPDLYAAVGVHSGLAAGAARGVASALAAMSRGHAGHGSAAGAAPVPPTIVFHGTRDHTVNPVNADEVVAQARAAGGLAATSEQGARGGRTFTRTVFADSSGRTAIEQWNVEGLGHAWSGGSADGSFADPAGPDASAEMLRFFLDHPRRG